MTIFVGVASFARSQAFKLCLYSLAKTSIVKGVIAVIDSRDTQEKDQYIETISEMRKYGLEVIADISDKRRGFVNARNKVLDLAEQILNDNDVLILYDDDYICPGAHTILSALTWFNDSSSVGLVGGRVVDLRRRSVDPDFYLNILPGLADELFKATGFVFLDTKHGPRYTLFTPPLRAILIKVLKCGVRFDNQFKGTGYRAEDDFNLQVVKLGYKIVFDPRFWSLHLCLEYGGCRTENLPERFYWKARNNAYFIRKHNLGASRLIASTMIITVYAILNGPKVLKATLRGFREGIKIAL